MARWKLIVFLVLIFLAFCVVGTIDYNSLVLR